jgi:signal transduction histidine kinase
MERDRIIENLRRRVDSLERSAALGLLVSAVVHEVNNPLSVILIGADTLRHTGVHSESVQRHLDVLNKQADRIIHITRSVQGLTRRNLSGGEEVDLCELLPVFAEVEEILSGTEARPTLVMPAGPLEVRAESQQLLLVLRYLARTARTRAGGGPLEVELGSEEVRLIQSGPAAARSPVRSYAVIRLRVGEPSGDAEPFSRLVPDFFGATREPDEVELMASWEVVRKLSGRLMVVGDGDGGIEIQALLPRLDRSKARL